jgi:hypothetical protein
VYDPKSNIVNSSVLDSTLLADAMQQSSNPLVTSRFSKRKSKSKLPEHNPITEDDWELELGDLDSEFRVSDIQDCLTPLEDPKIGDYDD